MILNYFCDVGCVSCNIFKDILNYNDNDINDDINDNDNFRPDLLDWRQVERRDVRERIDLAFHIMDREYGVTRLLDPEGKPPLINTGCPEKNTPVNFVFYTVTVIWDTFY